MQKSVTLGAKRSAAVGVRAASQRAASLVIGAHGVDSEAAEQSVQGAREIPSWRVDLVKDHGDSWWSRFGGFGRAVGDGMKQALWGNSLPPIASTPAQDQQRCPVMKLPEDFDAVAKSRSWTSFSGEWSTNSGVILATWEQNIFGMAFSRNTRQMGVSFRTASTGQVAVRTKMFTDKEMMVLYNWRAPPPVIETVGKHNFTVRAAGFNLVILDCVGTLMYVIREDAEQDGKAIRIYARDGSLVGISKPDSPILRYQWVKPGTKYLIATAEAPGYHADVKENDIPRKAELGNVLPFGFHFETGGYANSSLFMEPEFRWVIPTAQQALAIHKARHDFDPGTAVTVVEIVLILCAVLSILTVVGLLFCVYRVVYPPWHVVDRDHHGKVAENPFLAVPPLPPTREEAMMAAKANASGTSASGRYTRTGTYSRSRAF